MCNRRRSGRVSSVCRQRLLFEICARRLSEIFDNVVAEMMSILPSAYDVKASNDIESRVRDV